MNHTEDEVWKPIVGMSPRYEVSNLGPVRRVSKDIVDLRDPNIPHTGRVLSIHLQPGEHPVAMVRDLRGRMRGRKVYDLVVDAFIGRPGGKWEIHHVNGDRTDNRASNLVCGAIKTQEQRVRDKALAVEILMDRWWSTRTVCKGGHRLTDENTVQHFTGRPRCLECGALGV